MRSIGDVVRWWMMARFGSAAKARTFLMPIPRLATSLLALDSGRSPQEASVGRIRGKGDDLGVVRLRSRGGLDRSFGNDGIVRIDVYGSTDAGSAAALQTNGKLVVAGQTWRAGVPRFLVARLLGL